MQSSKLTGWDGEPYRPAISLLPLGTGNDLARVLGWGKSVRVDALNARLAALDSVRVSLLDRWRLAGKLPEGRNSVIMCNYLSIGVDAKAALLWARLAKRVPWLFRLRILNKVRAAPSSLSLSLSPSPMTLTLILSHSPSLTRPLASRPSAALHRLRLARVFNAFLPQSRHASRDHMRRQNY